MARFSLSTVVALSLFLSRALLPTAASPLTYQKSPRDVLSAVGADVAYVAQDEATGQLIAYHKDGSVAGVLPPSSLQSRAASGCRVMSVDEAKSLDGWSDIENYAKSNWGDGSYNLSTDYEGSTALVCVDSEPAVLNADATPSCTTQESETGGTLVGTSGTVSISFTQGYTTTSSLTVTESTSLGASMTATVGFKVFDLLDVGASVTTSTEVTNTSSEGFTVAQDARETQTITMNSAEGKTCHLKFSNKSCNVQGSGNIKYIGSGWVWFNYDDETQAHYRWAVNIEAVVPDVGKRSQSSTVRGLMSGTSTSDYQGECV